MPSSESTTNTHHATSPSTSSAPGDDPDVMDEEPSPAPLNSSSLSNYYDRDSFIFAVRISFVLTLSSLFVLVSSPHDPYPKGVWVFITCTVVSWFPGLDVASAFQKTVQRLRGTLAGASIGLAGGFLSLPLHPGSQAQAIFLGCLICVQTFGWSYYCHKSKLTGYAGILGLMTIGIVQLPFYTVRPIPWQYGVFRLVNICIGCGIGAASNLLIGPRSLKERLENKVESQMKLAGTSVRLLLDVACNANNVVDASSQLSMDSDTTTLLPLAARKKSMDEYQKISSKVMEDLKETKNLIHVLQFDPFFRKNNKHHERKLYEKRTRNALLRIFRLQSHVVSLDSMILFDCRYDEWLQRPHMSELLLRLGQRVEFLLDASNDESERKLAGQQLLEQDLIAVRGQMVLLRNKQRSKSVSEEGPEMSDVVRRVQKVLSEVADAYIAYPVALNEMQQDSEETIISFLNVIEYIIMSTLRLHYWTMGMKDESDGPIAVSSLADSNVEQTDSSA